MDINHGRNCDRSVSTLGDFFDISAEVHSEFHDDRNQRVARRILCYSVDLFVMAFIWAIRLLVVSSEKNRPHIR